jgi:hypothetical protein
MSKRMIFTLLVMDSIGAHPAYGYRGIFAGQG